MEDGYEFFADRQLVTIFSAPNYCGEFDNAGAMMSVDETLMCSFQILKPAEKKTKFNFSSTTTTKTGTPPPGIKVWIISAYICLQSYNLSLKVLFNTRFAFSFESFWFYEFHGLNYQMAACFCILVVQTEWTDYCIIVNDMCLLVICSSTEFND